MSLRRLIGAAGAAMACQAFAASADPLTADKLPPSLLADCDARAEPLTRAAPSIADAAAALIDIGALKRDDFQGAKLGFCSLQRAGGPVAATSCEHGIILLDEKFAGAGQTLNLRATLAHEMAHHRQHRERKARSGADYCAGLRYAADKPRLEAEADAFGDAVAALLLRGRPIEVINACDEPVSFLVEAESPVAVRGAAAAVEVVPAGMSRIAAERALSGRVRYYAETASRTTVWRDRTGPHERYVGGRLVRLRAATLKAPARIENPFSIRFACPAPN